jgi:hypothetical protein
VDSDGTCWVNITKRNFQKIKLMDQSLPKFARKAL